MAASVNYVSNKIQIALETMICMKRATFNEIIIAWISEDTDIFGLYNYWLTTEAFHMSWTDEGAVVSRYIMPMWRIFARICYHVHNILTRKKLKLNFSRIALFHMKTRVCLKYFVNDCLWKQFLASDLHLQI